MDDQLGVVCDEWDYEAKKCTSQVPVFQKLGTNSCYFTSKMAIDADGAPKAYYPGEYKPANDHPCFDWLNNLNVNDRHGVQGQNGAVGSAPGFLISGTALTDEHHFPENDTRRYVDASSIPYVVLNNGSLPVPAGQVLTKGCLVFVADTKTGNYSGAIYADVGRAVGEASLALALMLGINPFSKKQFPKVVGGVGQKRIFYLVFLNGIIPPPWDVPTIQQKAEQHFDAWGGETALRALYPGMPPMSGPRPVIIKPPDTLTADFEELDEAKGSFRGSDVSKAKLEELLSSPETTLP
jgi:hypothetical protein